MNTSHQHIENQMHAVSEVLRDKIEGAFTNLPVNEAAAATITVLAELAITYAIVAGVSAPTFVAAILKTWKQTSEQYAEFCKESEANEHLH